MTNLQRIFVMMWIMIVQTVVLFCMIFTPQFWFVFFMLWWALAGVFWWQFVEASRNGR